MTLVEQVPDAPEIVGRSYEWGEHRMMIGAHAIVYSRDAEADRAFLRDVLEFPSVDAGKGWLIFALPPAEVAVHPAEQNDRHELFLMCDDLDREIKNLTARGVHCSQVEQARWGAMTLIRLPGGGTVGLYQPRHATAISQTWAGNRKSSQEP